MKAAVSQKRPRRYLWAARKSRTATCWRRRSRVWASRLTRSSRRNSRSPLVRSEEHTSELQSRGHLVCRLLLEKKKKNKNHNKNKTKQQQYTKTPRLQ